MSKATTPTIPNEYVVRRPQDEMGGQRTITVRKFSTPVDFQRTNILNGVAKSRLVFGNEFGIIESYDEDKPERNIRAMCGLVGPRSLVLLNQQTSKPDYYRIKHVLLATLMIEFLPDPNAGKLDFLVYGGRQGYIELWEMLKDNFGVIGEPTSRVFTDIGLRNLCEKVFERLYQITIDPWYKAGWGTIKAADFKSSRGQFIDPNVDRMKQVLENKEILIQSFKSVLPKQMMTPPLEDAYDVKFQVLKDRGVSIEIPELKLPANKTDIAYESVLYDFARQTYGRIVGGNKLYEDISDDSESAQMSLFG